MSDQAEALQRQMVDQIVVVERQLVNVVDLCELIEIVEAGRYRSGDAVALLQRRQQRIGRVDAAQSMQPQNVRPLAPGKNLPAAATRQLDYCLFHDTASGVFAGAAAFSAASRGNQLSSH